MVSGGDAAGTHPSGGLTLHNTQPKQHRDRIWLQRTNTERECPLHIMQESSSSKHITCRQDLMGGL